MLWPRVPAERVLTPHVMVAVGVGLSFLAWILPWSDHVRRGFAHESPLRLDGVLVLVVWYLLIFFAAFLGYRIGRRTPQIDALNRPSPQSYYRWITVVAAIGVAYSYATVLHRLGLKRFWGAIEHRHFNTVRFAIDFHAGIQTLRYAAILGGGIALFRIVRRRKVGTIDVLNLVLLVAAAAIASRLSVVLAAFVAVALVVRAYPGWTLTPGRIAVLFALFFVFVTPLNYVRNANYYERRYHTSNPFVMNAYEIISYVGGPFQVSLGVANRAAETLRRPGQELISRSVLQNGSFENGNLYGWSATVSDPKGGHPRIVDGSAGAGEGVGRLEWAGDSLGVKRGVGMSGTHAVEARTRAASDAYAYLVYRTLSPVTAGRKYVVSAAFKRGDAQGSAQALLVLICHDRRGRLLRSIAPTTRATGMVFADRPFVPSSSWTRYGGGFSGRFPRGTASVQVQVYPLLAAAGSADVFVDDVRFGPVEPREVPRSALHVLAPTYVSPAAPAFRRQKESYRDYVDIQNQLTTNSVLSELWGPLGFFAFPLIALVSFVAAIFAGHASRYGSYFFLAGYVTIYAFAELWRTYLFNTGVIHFLVLMLALLPLLALGAGALRRRLLEQRPD